MSEDLGVRERVTCLQRELGVPVRAICRALGIHRSQLYARPKGSSPAGRMKAMVPDAEVIPVLRELAGRFPTYGHRRLKVLVSRQLGRPVNRKRILRLLREEGLLTEKRTARARPRPHPRKVEATGTDQVWQMDFTKLVVGERWAWLLVVMDRFSREIINYGLSWRGRAQEVIEVLDEAVLERFPEGVRGAGLKIASDNGSAFLAESVQSLARDMEMELMHTRIRYPEGNGRCERVIRTVKEEEVWLNQYETLEEARERIAAFIEFYNHERIHSSLGYLSPRQYAALWREVESAVPEKTLV